MAKVVKDIKELKKLAKRTDPDFFILLNQGVISRKRISYDAEEKKFFIFNLIDETEQELTETELFTEATNIGKALKLGALYSE